MADSVLLLLRQEFEDDDLQCKRRASEKLDVVARSLGPERTRGELVPFLMEHLQEHDEVLFIMAQKSMVLVDLLGGVGKSDCLLPLLEALLAMEDLYVRKAASDCAKKLIAEANTDDFKMKAVDAISRLSKSEFQAKMSACSLCGVAMQSKLLPQDSSRLKEIYLSLCKDEMPLVRRAAAQELGEMLQESSAEDIVSDFVPLFSKLVADAQHSVALAWTSEIGRLAEHLTPELNEEHILGMIQQFCSDRSWRIRYTLAQIFDQLVKGSFTAQTTRGTLLPLFLELLRDPEGEVRNVASAHVISICEAVGSEACASQVCPILTGLVEMDQQKALRQNLAKATADMRILKLLGKDKVGEHLIPLYELFLKDSPELRLVILNGLPQIVETLGPAKAAPLTSLLSEIFESSKHFPNNSDAAMAPVTEQDVIEHPFWRLRVSILNAVGALADEKLITKMWFLSLSDEIFEVRKAAAKMLGKFAESSSLVGPNKVTSVFIPKLLEFFKQSKAKYSHRIVFLIAVAELLKFAGMAEPCFPGFEKCCDDKVPNVRIAAMRVLKDIQDPAFIEKFAPKIQALARDTDPDVNYEAKSAAKRLGIQ